VILSGAIIYSCDNPLKHEKQLVSALSLTPQTLGARNGIAVADQLNTAQDVPVQMQRERRV
jgi:hypothetical protein